MLAIVYNYIYASLTDPVSNMKVSVHTCCGVFILTLFYRFAVMVPILLIIDNG